MPLTETKRIMASAMQGCCPSWSLVFLVNTDVSNNARVACTDQQIITSAFGDTNRMLTMASVPTFCCCCCYRCIPTGCVCLQWVVVVASTAGMEQQDWVDALSTLVDNALAD